MTDNSLIDFIGFIDDLNRRLKPTSKKAPGRVLHPGASTEFPFSLNHE